MKIATFGSGHIGGTLGKSWARKGHSVMFCSRNPQSEKMIRLVQDAGTKAKAGSVTDGLAFAEVILLALPPADIEDVLKEVGDLRGKILINATNRRDGKSANDEVVRLAKNARVIRAFNSLAWEVLQNPQYGTANATMFILGDDDLAKQIVAGLARDAGLDPVDAGLLANCTLIESALGSLWTILGPQFGRDHCLRVLRRAES